MAGSTNILLPVSGSSLMQFNSCWTLPDQLLFLQTPLSCIFIIVYLYSLEMIRCLLELNLLRLDWFSTNEEAADMSHVTCDLQRHYILALHEGTGPVPFCIWPVHCLLRLCFFGKPITADSQTANCPEASLSHTPNASVSHLVHVLLFYLFFSATLCVLHGIASLWADANYHALIIERFGHYPLAAFQNAYTLCTEPFACPSITVMS